MGEVDLLLPLACARSTSGKAKKQGEKSCNHTHGSPQSHFPHKKNRLCNGYDEPSSNLIKGVAKDRRISIEDADMGTDEKAGACVWMDTNGMSSTIWIPV